MNGPMDDERFDASLRAFLAAEAERTAAAAPPVGETLARLRETAGPPSRGALAPAWLLIVLALLLTAALATSLALGSGLIKLSLLVSPSPSASAVPCVLAYRPDTWDPIPTSDATLQPGVQETITLCSSPEVEATLQIPATGWRRYGPALTDGAGFLLQDPVVGDLVAIEVPFQIFVDPCDAAAIYQGPGPYYGIPAHGWAAVGSTIDDLAGALEASLANVPNTIVQGPVEATLGGLPARRLTVVAGGLCGDPGHLSTLWNVAPMDMSGMGNVPLLGPDRGTEIGPTVDGWPTTWWLYVVDVRGTPVIVAARFNACGSCSGSEPPGPTASPLQNPPDSVAAILDSIGWP